MVEPFTTTTTPPTTVVQSESETIVVINTDIFIQIPAKLKVYISLESQQSWEH